MAHYWIATVLVLTGAALLGLTNGSLPSRWHRDLCGVTGFTFFVVGATQILGLVFIV